MLMHDVCRQIAHNHIYQFVTQEMVANAARLEFSTRAQAKATQRQRRRESGEIKRFGFIIFPLELAHSPLGCLYTYTMNPQKVSDGRSVDDLVRHPQPFEPGPGRTVRAYLERLRADGACAVNSEAISTELSLGNTADTALKIQKQENDLLTPLSSHQAAQTWRVKPNGSRNTWAIDTLYLDPDRFDDTNPERHPGNKSKEGGYLAYILLKTPSLFQKLAPTYLGPHKFCDPMIYILHQSMAPGAAAPPFRVLGFGQVGDQMELKIVSRRYPAIQNMQGRYIPETPLFTDDRNTQFYLMATLRRYDPERISSDGSACPGPADVFNFCVPTSVFSEVVVRRGNKTRGRIPFSLRCEQVYEQIVERISD